MKTQKFPIALPKQKTNKQTKPAKRLNNYELVIA